MYCDEVFCFSNKVLFSSKKCYTCFIAALQNSDMCREWMIDFKLKTYRRKTEDGNFVRLTYQEVVNQTPEFEFCGDTHAVIMDKLGLPDLFSNDLHSNLLLNNFSAIQDQHFVFAAAFGISDRILTHVLTVIGDYLIHSYYTVHGLKVIKITPKIQHAFDDNDFESILSFSDNDEEDYISQHKNDKIYYYFPDQQ